MADNMEELKDQENLVTRHIPSRFAAEMSHKSKVVCLSILTFTL